LKKEIYTKENPGNIHTLYEDTGFKLRAAGLNFRIVLAVQPCRGRQKTLKYGISNEKESIGHLEKAIHAAKYVVHQHWYFCMILTQNISAHSSASSH